MPTETITERQVHEFTCELCGELTATLQPGITCCDDCERESLECERCGERHHESYMHGELCDDCHNHQRVSWQEAYREAHYRKANAGWGAK